MANHYYFVGRDMPTAELCLLRGGVAAVQERRASINEISPYYCTNREGRICNKGTGYNKSIWSLRELRIYRLTHGSENDNHDTAAAEMKSTRWEAIRTRRDYKTNEYQIKFFRLLGCHAA